jgi:hypothetical protein
VKAIEKLRAIFPSEVARIEDAVARKRVAELLVDYRILCADVGPWEYAASIGAPPEADLRQIAYLAVWSHGPTVGVWEFVRRLDAVDLLIDAAVEGFEAHVVANPC